LGEKLGTADDLALLLQAQPPSLVSRLTVIGASTPTPAVSKRRVRVYRKGASRTKRSADVCLVLDVSGSMQGGKLAAATQGVTTLLERLEGENPNASLILFSGRVDRRVPMRPVASGRRAFADTLKRVRGDGGTALLDAVVAALDELRSSAVPDNLKVLLLFTDGQENSSTTSRPAAEAALSRSGVLFFGIGCGQDADHELLRGLAAASGGHSLVIGQHEIERVYATLSRHI
jgi:Ca-activated chloride channel family protein